MGSQPSLPYPLTVLLNASSICRQNKSKTTIWANVQRDGRPAKYRWCPLFNAAIWLMPTTRVPFSNAAKMRNPLKCAGVPHQTGQQISAASGPKFTYCEDMWGRHCCLTSFFPIVDTCLSCPTQLCNGAQMANFLGPAFPASCVQHISNLYSKFTLGPHHVYKYGRHPICDR